MSEKPMGCLITLDGIDGSGKTTQLLKLQALLESLGFDVVRTREPGGTPQAENIRNLLLNPPKGEIIDPLTDALLFFAARNQHIHTVIKPAIEAGKIVLCDRFLISTYAYQVDGDGLPPSQFYNLVYNVVTPHTVVTDNMHMLLLNVLDEVSKARCIARSGGNTDRWDNMDDEKRQRINTSYRNHANMVGVISIDANEDEESVFKVIKEKVYQLLSDKHPNLHSEALVKLEASLL